MLETRVGGAPKNRQVNHRVGSKQGLTDKTPVVALVDQETGKVRARVVANVNAKNLTRVLAETCVPTETHLNTDESNVYTKLGRSLASHGAVNCSAGEYVRDGISTNAAESFFSKFKRPPTTGTHHNVSMEHLHRYASELEYRWNTSKMTNAERVQTMVDGSVSKRLTYRPLITCLRGPHRADASAQGRHPNGARRPAMTPTIAHLTMASEVAMSRS